MAAAFWKHCIVPSAATMICKDFDISLIHIAAPSMLLLVVSHKPSQLA
jgi:hypothetical protein